jgi:hypothetical protein
MSDKFYVAERLFEKGNPYFDSFYLVFDRESLRSFFRTNDDKRVYLTHLFFYVECLVHVKNIPHGVADLQNVGGLAPLHSDKLWYANLLVILIGIIDKTVSPQMSGEKCESCGRSKNKAINSLKKIMSGLSDSDQKYFIKYYKGGAFRTVTFSKIVEDIYSDRTYFAHEISSFNPPEKDGLTFDMKKEGVFIAFNIKPAEILLTIILALLKYWGYEKELVVSTSKACDKLSDLL